MPVLDWDNAIDVDALDARDMQAKANAPELDWDNAIEVGGQLPTTDRTWGEAGKDLVASFGSGANSLVEMAGTGYGLLTGDMDNWAREQGASGREYFNEMKSAGLQQSERERQMAVAAADGELAKFGTAFWETIKNPALLSSLAAEQIPMFVPIGVVGRGASIASTATGLAGKAAGVAGKAAQGVAGTNMASNALRTGLQGMATKEGAALAIGTGAGIGAGAGMQASDIAGESYEELMKLPQALWEKNPEYQALRQQVGDEDAKHRLSLENARMAASEAGVASVLSNMLPWARAIEKTLAGAPSKMTGNVLMRGAKAAIGEGAQEAIEEGWGGVAQNRVVGEIDPSRSLMQGVGERAGIGAVGGMVIGGPLGAMAPAEVQATKQQPAPTAPTPADILQSPDIDSAIAAADALVSSPVGPQFPDIEDIEGAPPSPPFAVPQWTAQQPTRIGAPTLQPTPLDLPKGLINGADAQGTDAVLPAPGATQTGSELGGSGLLAQGSNTALGAGIDNVTGQPVASGEPGMASGTAQPDALISQPTNQGEANGLQEQGQAPAETIDSLRQQLAKAEPFSANEADSLGKLVTAVAQDAARTIESGEMPVFRVGKLAVAITPSAQNPGKFQVTRYNDSGALGDSQYNSVEDAIRQEGLAEAPRLSQEEAGQVMQRAAQAEAEYQKRRAEVDQPATPLSEQGAPGAVVQPSQQPSGGEANSQGRSAIDELIGMETDAGAGFKQNDSAIEIVRRASGGFVPSEKANVTRAINQFTEVQRDGTRLIKPGFYERIGDLFAYNRYLLTDAIDASKVGADTTAQGTNNAKRPIPATPEAVSTGVRNEGQAEQVPAPVAEAVSANPQEVRAYKKDAAKLYAMRMTKQGLPSEVYPHPTKDGMWAIRPVGETERKAEAQAKPAEQQASSDYTVTPARYAKSMMLVKSPPSDGFKTRAARLAEAIAHGRYTHREGGYVMTKPAAARFEKLYAEGWDANSVTGELRPPEGQEKAPEFVKVRDVYGYNHYVKQGDLNGDRDLIQTFTQDGKRKDRLHRGNLDLDGVKQRAQNADANPLDDVVLTKNGKAFINKVAAQREMNRRQFGESHEIVPASELHEGAKGFVLRRKRADIQKDTKAPEYAPDQDKPKDISADILKEPTEQTPSDAGVSVSKPGSEDVSAIWEGRAQPSVDASSSTPFADPSPAETGEKAAIPSGSVSNIADPQAEGNTEDAGEELSYNRRNRAGRLTWGDIKDQEAALRIKEVTKAKVYPKPDYAELADEIGPVKAHLVKQVYDKIAAKPQTGRDAPTDTQLEAYIDSVNRVMDAMLAWAKDAVFESQWRPTASGKSLVETLYPDGWRAQRDEINLLGGNRYFGGVQPGYDEIKRAEREIAKGWPVKREAWQTQGYEIIETAEDVKLNGGPQSGTASYYIEAGNNYLGSVPSKEAGEMLIADLQPWLLLNKSGRIVSQHQTEEEAIEAARNATKRGSKGGVSDKGIAVENAERIGPARRMEGENVTSDKLKETFGFRGVNFGTWMKGKANEAERQLHLNHAYDAFLDLAEILDVPPQAMSLNGMLGLAIGAQGNGKAAAHFVPGVNEINLTRTSGAGSLAHEFGHALDHYFARLGGMDRRVNPFLTEHTGSPAQGDLRPEILDKFNAIVKAMNERQMTQAEYAEHLRKRIETLKTNVDSWTKAIRRDFESAAIQKVTVEDGKKRREKALEKFDALVKRIRDKDLGDGRVAISRYEAVSPVVMEIRELYKETFGKVMSKNNTLGLQSNIDSLVHATAKQEADKSHVPQTVKTDYARNATALDKDKGGKPYWSTDLEKFARAFDAFVTDTLEARAAKNSYLSHAGREGDTVPAGEERKAINEAFKALVDTIQTKETDSGVAMYDLSGVDQDANNDLPHRADIIAESAARRAIDRAMAIEQGKDLRPLQRAMVTATLRRNINGLADGKVSEARFIGEIEHLYRRLVENRTAKKMEPRQRVRGALWIRQKLLDAVRNGEISEREMDIAEWLIKQNPTLVDDLGISVKTPKEGQKASGQYDQLRRIVTLFAGNSKDTTAAHEILHHSERLMPSDIQRAVREEWLKGAMRLLKRADLTPEYREYLEKAIASQIDGDAKAAADAMKIYAQGRTGDNTSYQWLNPSEYWAVNASRLLAKRFDAQGSIWTKAYNWLQEFIEKVKGALGLKSNAEVIRALDQLIHENRGGKVAADSQMLGVGESASDISPDDAFWSKIESGESFSWKELQDAYSIGRRGSDRRIAGISKSDAERVAGYRAASVPILWDENLAGAGRYYSTGKTLASKENLPRFAVSFIPEAYFGGKDFSSANDLMDSAVVSYVFTQRNDGKWNLSINDPEPGSTAYAELDKAGRLDRTGDRTEDGEHEYVRPILDDRYKTSSQFMQEAIRRLGFLTNDVPTVIVPSRETGSRAGDKESRIYQQDTIRNRFDLNINQTPAQAVVSTSEDGKIDAGRPLGELLYTFDRNQIVELYGDKLPELKDYKRIQEQIVADRNQMLYAADDFLDKLRAMPAGVRDRFASIAHEATIDGIDPSEEYNESGRIAEMRRVRDGLMKREQEFGLTEKQRGYLDNLNTALNAMPDRHAALRNRFSMLPKEAQQLFVGLRDQYRDASRKVFDELEARIQRMGIDEDSKKGAIQSLRKEFDRVKSTIYFPLARFGKFVVIGTKVVNGVEIRQVEYHESEKKAAQAAVSMRADGYAVKRTLRKAYSEELAKGQAISDIVSKVKKLRDTKQADAFAFAQLDALLDDINQAIIQMMPDASYRRHFMHRKNVPGYSGDFIRAYADSMWKAGNHIANLRHSDQIENSIKGMQKRIDAADGDVTALQDVVNHVIKREEVLKQQVSPVAAAIGQAGFLAALASASNLIVNMTQTPVLSFPWIGARYGYTAASAKLTSAMLSQVSAFQKVTSLRQIGQAIDMRNRLKGDELKVFNRLHDTGKIDITQAYDLIDAANNDTPINPNSPWNVIMKVGALPQHISEVFNRQITALSVVRLELAKSGDVDAAFDEAVKVIDQTHYDYEKSNRALLMHGNTQRVVFMFKQYAQKTAYLWARTAWLAMKGAGVDKKVARRQIAGMLAMQFAVSGVLGLPIFLEAGVVASGVAGFRIAGKKGAYTGIGLAILAAVAMAFGDDEDDFDTEVRQWLSDTLGKTWGEVVARGAVRLTGVDISSRVNADELIVRKPDPSLEGKDYYTPWVESLGGFVFGYGANVAMGISLINDGKIERGLEKMIPVKQIRDIMTAHRFGTEGATNLRGSNLLKGSKAGDDPTAWEIAVKAVGFQPARIAEVYEGNASVKNAERRLNTLRTDLLDRLWEAKRTGDMKEFNRIRFNEVAKFNNAHPTHKITIETIGYSMRARKRSENETVGGIRMSRKHKSLRDRGSYANR